MKKVKIITTHLICVMLALVTIMTVSTSAVFAVNSENESNLMTVSRGDEAIVGTVDTHWPIEPTTNGKYFDEDANAVELYYKSINDGNWKDSDDVISRQCIDSMIDGTVDSEVEHKHSGVDNITEIKSAEVLTEIVTDDYAFYYTDIAEPHCYFVRVDAKTYANDGFNWNGRNYHVVICGTEKGVRKVFDVRLPLPYTVNENEPNIAEANAYLDMRFGNEKAGTKDYNVGDTPRTYNGEEPSSIRVKRSSGTIETVEFMAYVKCVMCAEICPPTSSNYSEAIFEWCKANAIAIRNFAWYRYLSAEAIAPYHITDSSTSDQVYRPEAHGDPSRGGHSLAAVVEPAVEAIWEVKMSNEDYEIFLPRYADGSYDSSGKYGGQLKQKGSKYLAVELGYDYKQILHYYYDYATNSNYPVGNGGRIHINEPGDADLNDTLNTADATRILQHVSGDITLTGLSLTVADFNLDGNVNTADASTLLSYLIND